jgi:predicted TIM-barrel fold metal-dependent hydrolase
LTINFNSIATDMSTPILHTNTQPDPAPLCAAPDPAPRHPKFKLPPLACDSHFHVFGPDSMFPYYPKRIYTPPEAPLSTYLRLLGILGAERAVFIQPSVYGADNRAMLAALAQAGDRFRGVAVVGESVTDSELEKLHAAGVRGVRINVVDVAEAKGVIPMAPLKRMAERIKPLGWHVEFLMHADEFPNLDGLFADFPVDIVLGHLGYMRTDKGMDAPGFQALLRLMRAGRCWVKLTGPSRITTTVMPYPDVTPFAHALIDAAPERVIWGTDWPHVIIKGAMPNDGDLCDLLLEWVPDEDTRTKVLVHNPARLYGFN